MIDADPLYVNFTSGSTGTPKGVVVCHRNVCEFIPCFAETFAITEKDVLANQAPFDFDVSVKDIYSGLFTPTESAAVACVYRRAGGDCADGVFHQPDEADGFSLRPRRDADGLGGQRALLPDDDERAGL